MKIVGKIPTQFSWTVCSQPIALTKGQWRWETSNRWREALAAFLGMTGSVSEENSILHHHPSCASWTWMANRRTQKERNNCPWAEDEWGFDVIFLELVGLSPSNTELQNSHFQCNSQTCRLVLHTVIGVNPLCAFSFCAYVTSSVRYKRGRGERGEGREDRMSGCKLPNVDTLPPRHLIALQEAKSFCWKQ